MEVANCIYGSDKRHVPFVYYNGKKVGTYRQLYEMDQRNEIKPQLPSKTE